MEWEPRKNSFYIILNDTLRHSDREQLLLPWFKFLKLFLTALSKLPLAGHRTIYRGVKLDLREKYNEGTQIVWWGFSSCTTTVKVLENDSFFGKRGTRTLFAIECDTGKEIREHSFYRKEDEILLLPGREFEVVSSVYMGHKLTMIQLKEIVPQFPNIASIISSKYPAIAPSLTTIVPVTETEGPKPALQFETVIQSMKASYKSKSITDADIERAMEDALVQQQCIELDLSWNEITHEGVAKLAKKLRNNTTLTALNLQANRIDTIGAQHLADTLQYNNTLTTLDLYNNQIGDNGAQHLADALRNNKILTTLDLGANGIKTLGTQHLASALQNNTTLTTLDFTGNQIGHKGVQHLADALQNNTTLTTLYLGGNQIGILGAQYLAEALRHNTALTTLYLGGNQIEAFGAQHLADVFKKNTTLTTLDLIGNQIGDKGAQYLADALQQNMTLTTLNLQVNLIGDKGARRLADALINNTTLTTLDLHNNQIKEKLEYRLKELIERNKQRTKS
ncbi:unnamed protein product [Rotaria sordida]|uniref:NAD(P)(+)--arginine ADP-ribosyltransferase n=1 Tax=Rotaria sordida TaxID=392033 RepID=A0A814D145_9BILA|nr:unnamed protein product [Rotaria sordida]CAF0990453.1 unnamed protein product [Rotaria sordida]